jgi:hypothetical protein
MDQSSDHLLYDTISLTEKQDIKHLYVLAF